MKDVHLVRGKKQEGRYQIQDVSKPSIKAALSIYIENNIHLALTFVRKGLKDFISHACQDKIKNLGLNIDIISM